MLKQKPEIMKKVTPVKDYGDTRRGTYIFEDITEAVAWDNLLASSEQVRKLIAADPTKTYPSQFINIEALNALCDRRSGNFINPEFLAMLDGRVKQMGYDIVDECKRQGWVDDLMKQHVNYYYDYVLSALKLRKAQEEEFYRNRHGLVEQVAAEYAERKKRYEFVDQAESRLSRTSSTERQPE